MKVPRRPPRPLRRREPTEPIGDPADPRGFEALAAAYLDWLRVHQSTEVSVKAFGERLRIFGRWCAERGVVRPGDVTRELVERYQRHLFHHRRTNGQPLGFRTQMVRLAAVRSF